MDQTERMYGVIHKVWQNPKTWAISLGDNHQRVTGFGKCPFTENQEIDIYVKWNKGFCNFVKENTKASASTHTDTSVSSDIPTAREVTKVLNFYKRIWEEATRLRAMEERQ